MKYISKLPSSNWEKEWPRKICIMGSTGSIGRSALACIHNNSDKFIVTGLAGAYNVKLLAEQANQYKPSSLGVISYEKQEELLPLLDKGYSPRIYVGSSGYFDMVKENEALLILAAQVGSGGIYSVVSAAKSGKIIALANKESLVMAGELIRDICHKTNSVILPVDSEHNAIFQCLSAAPEDSFSHIVLTASGGPFQNYSKKELENISLADAVKHPTWSMGQKISIDSATLMNKGLEVIEAHHLYGLSYSQIEVVIHKESIIHSLVARKDGSQIAQLSYPNMSLAIAHCIGWPNCLHTNIPRLNLSKLGSLTFKEPNHELFPCLNLAKEALQAGQFATIVLNAANEVAVDSFIRHKISFLDISSSVSYILKEYLKKSSLEVNSLEDILALDIEARNLTASYIGLNKF